MANDLKSLLTEPLTKANATLPKGFTPLERDAMAKIQGGQIAHGSGPSGTGQNREVNRPEQTLDAALSNVL